MFDSLISTRLFNFDFPDQHRTCSSPMIDWLRKTHQESTGKPSWTRQASSISLVILLLGLLTGDVEWGSNFVLVFGIVFGAKGIQKQIEEKATKMAPSS